MTPRGELRAVIAAACALWLLFFVQAINSPLLLDDWFQLRYWRDHEFGPSSIWAYARHNYFHYNPRLGEVLLAIVNGPQIVHLILTPLVQLAVLPTVFAIAFARWPRPTLRDLQLLLFIQTMIWLVIPIPGIIYFYRPITTNYLWAFTITLALFVPYRLALAGRSTQPRRWLVPIMFGLGWAAGMCNEHTGPTAMVAMAIFVYAAWKLARLRAWMVAGMLGLFVGYPMLFFAPGQAVRYGGLATKDTPTKLLADRGITGCLAILRDFLFEARLALLLFAAAVVCYALTVYARGRQIVSPPRGALVEAGVLAAAAGSIVFTLFVSPTTTDRLFYASGVLVVAALSIGAAHLFVERIVRRAVVAACLMICGYHVVRFIDTYATVKAENDERLAIMRTAAPGSVAVVPTYSLAERSRWHMGDDFVYYPWLRNYIGSELFDLSRVDLDREEPVAAARLVASRLYDPPRADKLPRIRHVLTYRQLQTPAGSFALGAQIGKELGRGLARFRITSHGLFDDLQLRPIIVVDWTRRGYQLVDGQPYHDARGHFIRVRRSTLPKRLETTYVVGCNLINQVSLVIDDPHADPLVPVDERWCRGPFTAVMCEPDRCWIAGWY